MAFRGLYASLREPCSQTGSVVASWFSAAVSLYKTSLATQFEGGGFFSSYLSHPNTYTGEVYPRLSP